jgi:hypothetical protein
MIHLSPITCTQILLIEIGLVLLIIAFRSHMMGPTGYHRHFETREDEGRHSDEDRKSAKSESAHTEDRVIDKPALTRTASLFRTSKVKFVQTFKFREYDPHQRHLPHH